MPIEVLKRVDDTLTFNQAQESSSRVIPRIYFKKVTKVEATKRGRRWKSTNCLW